MKKVKIYKKYDLQYLRETDLTRFINTPVRIVNGKRQTFCPFHKESTPSFFIYPDNSYYCFGCGAHGNAIDFVMSKLGLSFSDACEELGGL